MEKGGADEPKETARSCQPSVPITQRLHREAAGRVVKVEEKGVHGGCVENVCASGGAGHGGGR